MVTRYDLEIEAQEATVAGWTARVREAETQEIRAARISGPGAPSPRSSAHADLETARRALAREQARLDDLRAKRDAWIVDRETLRRLGMI